MYAEQARPRLEPVGRQGRGCKNVTRVVEKFGFDCLSLSHDVHHVSIQPTYCMKAKGNRLLCSIDDFGPCEAG